MHAIDPSSTRSDKEKAGGSQEAESIGKTLTMAVKHDCPGARARHGSIWCLNNHMMCHLRSRHDLLADRYAGTRDDTAGTTHGSPSAVISIALYELAEQ